MLILLSHTQFLNVIHKLKRTPGIFLVGFMGCGKSTIGSALAEELGWTFRDLDAEIEREHSMTIAEIFDRDGEEEFRRLESTALKKAVRCVQSGRPHVVSLGGGAFLREANFELVSHNGVAIWLDCPLHLIEQRLNGTSHRPLARDPQHFRELFAARRQSYARADYRIDIASDEPQDAVKQILALQLL